MPNDVPPGEKIDKLVRALQQHRDTLVRASLHLKDLLANLKSEQRQAVAAQLERYLADMAKGAQAADGNERPNLSKTGPGVVVNPVPQAKPSANGASSWG